MASSPVEWQTTKSAAILYSPQHCNSQIGLFFEVNSVVAADGDKLNTNDYVIFRQDNHFDLGKVVEILSSFEQPRMASHIALSRLEFLPRLHHQLRVPCVKFFDPELMVVIPPKVRLCSPPL